MKGGNNLSQTQLASLRLGAPYISKRERTDEPNRANSVIHITNGRTDDIIGFFTQKDTIFNEHTQNLETYQDSFEFTSFGDHKYAHTLTDMNRVIIPAEDGGYSEYVINTARKSRNRSNQVRVKTFASYQMLSVAKVIRPTSLSAYTPSQALGFITNGTEWRPGITESNATRTFHIENHTDRLSFLKTVANEYELEIRFRVETDGKRVTGRFIDLLERVGDWRGREITFGKDLDSIERTEEFGNIYTKLICLGPEDEEGNRLEIEVTDDDALRRWGRPHPITGELMHLEDTYEPTSERTDMTETELRQYGRTELNKRINSIVTYEAEVVDLENVPGMANKKIRFGDTVRIKDKKFNPPLYVEARIFEQRRDIFTKSNKKVKLGDFIEYTEDELRAVIDRLSKIIQTKISQSQLVEHTYSKIEIDDKDQYVFDEGKTFAEAVGVEAKEYAESEDEALKIDVEGYADGVASQAEDNAKIYADDVSAQALQQALAESVAQEAYDTKMAQIADELGDKAGITYVDGKLQIVDGAIDDLNAEIDTKADGSTVYTISEVDNMINNTVSLTQYTTDIDGIVQDLSDQSTQIGQNTEAIGLKADQTTVNALAGTIDDHSAQFLTMADEISARVTADYVQTAIDDVEIGGRNLLRNSDRFRTDQSTGSISFPNTQEIIDAINENDFVTVSVYVEFDNADENAHPNNRIGYELGLRHDDNSISTLPVWVRPSNGDSFKGRIVNVINVSNIRKVTELRHNGVYVQIGGENLKAGQPKIEKGNKATDWTPAPEDVEAEISSLSAELSVQAGIIEAKADSSTVNALGTRTTTAESKINSLEGEIVNKVNTSTYNTLSGTVSNLSTTVSQQATTISQKANSSTVTAIGNRVSTAETKISGLEGEITSKVSTTQFDALDGTVTDLQSTVTQTAQDVQFAFDEIDDMGNKINNAVTTIDGSGVTVADGSFFLKDSQTSEKYSIVPKDNLVSDHSFEFVEYDNSSMSVPYQWFNVTTPRSYKIPTWYWSGTPKVAMSLAGERSSKAIFGGQGVAVRSNDFFISVPIDVSPSTTYTLSCHFKRQNGLTGGSPRLEVYRVDALGDPSTLIASKTFTAVKSDYSVARHALTFTTPSTLGETDGIEVRIKSSNTNWVHADGVQIVQGEHPTTYDPETSFWEMLRGSNLYHAPKMYADEIDVNIIHSSPGFRLRIGTDEAMTVFENGNVMINRGLLNINSGTGHLRAGYIDSTISSNSAGYFGVNNSLRVTDGNFWQGSASATNYKEVQASNFNTISLVEKKKNIKSISVKGLDIINKSDLYEYSFKEDDDSMIRYGLVIGDGYRTPKEILDSEGVSISQYDMNTFSWLAIQELSRFLDDLKTENQLLKNELKIIKERIT